MALVLHEISPADHPAQDRMPAVTVIEAEGKHEVCTSRENNNRFSPMLLLKATFICRRYRFRDEVR